MDPVRELPYWPAAMALLIEAGQMTASGYVPAYPDLLLASEGASTDAIPQRCVQECYPPARGNLNELFYFSRADDPRRGMLPVSYANGIAPL